MIKFKITPERCAEALNIMDYLIIQSGDFAAAARVAPRFVLGADGEYIVKVTVDEDGDIEKLDGLGEAMLRLSAVTPKRLERLSHELTEAVRSIVDPTSGGGSKKPSSTAPEPPPPG